MQRKVALSQEIVWKLDSMRQRVHLRIQQKASNINGTFDQVKASKILLEVADQLSPENGTLGREHQERHTRIMFRLNLKKDLHVALR